MDLNRDERRLVEIREKVRELGTLEADRMNLPMRLRALRYLESSLAERVALAAADRRSTYP
jgi:hypothetical protein